jgi:hypothetical protein
MRLAPAKRTRRTSTSRWKTSYESWSDDPVRMYLTQMGEIPLLTRQQEISLAKQIEITRRRFRRKLLECDYVISGLQGAQAGARRASCPSTARCRSR